LNETNDPDDDIPEKNGIKEEITDDDEYLEDEEEIEEEVPEEEIEEEVPEEEKPKKEGFIADALGFTCFLIFILLTFFLIISWWQGTYPFQAVPFYNLLGVMTGYQSVFYDRIGFDIIYWAAFGCLLLGLWRYKYEYWLIILVGILGTMMFFMFFF
jgi:hypothetical protein